MTDFLKEIEIAESKASDIVKQAKLDADSIVQKAEREAADITEEACSKANINKKAMIKNAETDAQSKCKTQELELDKQIEVMRKSARNNMEQAVRVIVEKVGSI